MFLLKGDYINETEYMHQKTSGITDVEVKKEMFQTCKNTNKTYNSFKSILNLIR